ncbi:MAG: NMD protein affecting ribosome stability and mRNA decay [ANME-2 cluster archaeon]|nr:NMD protein affecting ribosome stability and mRNA decay [ANME-2 cluster archaeon]MBC2700992.1 NMD protein affecting ribosome stability and mRNA decay [ANME-2 cluster archaeon]MBC2706296.1 NMD protein affecting ribosome stability and mRNA decay [ANME-2 cluster archaeon]MBC2745704.1 NMD protein affecting ribosome stability and mRNA decay [ANME-2 cluster archaeon]MBC2763412.1 NMD protein affecting ribosome stability and mRNA decay [ANME-2 cluster archaeon]
MKNLACPICGRPADNLINGRCKDCFLKTFTLARIPHIVRTIICPLCASVKKGGHWEGNTAELEDVIQEGIKEALKLNSDAGDAHVSIDLTNSDPSIYHAGIRIDASVKEIRTNAALKTEVRVSRETCDTCSRIAGGYYEAMVQVRAEGRFPDEEEQLQLVELIEEVIERQYRKGYRLAFITKVDELPEGTDVYIGSNSSARQACKLAAERFGCSYSESPSLVGKKDGKDIYRITYSLRLPRFVPGDIINAGGDTVLIRHSGKRTSGLLLGSGLEFSENTNRLKDAVKIADMGDAVDTVLISVEDDIVQVMHPTTFKPVTLKKPAHLSGRGGEDIRIVIISDEVFILPPYQENE